MAKTPKTEAETKPGITLSRPAFQTVADGAELKALALPDGRVIQVAEKSDEEARALAAGAVPLGGPPSDDPEGDTESTDADQ